MPRRLLDRIHAPETTAMLDVKSTALPTDAGCPDDPAMVKRSSVLKIEWLLSQVPRKAIMAATDTATSTVTEWKRTGRIDKKHLPKLAQLTGTVSDWWLDPEAPVPPTGRWLLAPGTSSMPPQRLEEPNVHYLPRRRSDDAGETLPVSMLSVEASAGTGSPQTEHDPIIGTLRLSTAWIRTHLRSLSRLDNLVTIIAYGDSMSPTFGDGSILLVDSGVREIQVDAIYVVARRNELFVKRIQRRFTDGAFLIISDNPSFENEVVLPSEADPISVLGRVVWAFCSRSI